MSVQFSREQFLGLGAAMAAFSALPAAASASDRDHPDRVDYALVLSGGGARGAYTAGLIEAIASKAGVRDGQPLTPYGIICGTSIGALNGYFVATGQYSLLRNLWYSIGNTDAVRLKKRFASVANPNSGIGTRIVAALNLALGMNSNVTGVIDTPHLRQWLSQFINPATPTVTPIVWAATNLTRQAPEFFFKTQEILDASLRARAVQAVKATVGPTAALREATPDILLDALLASASIPAAFDPVLLPDPQGGPPAAYVDGGVTANTPIGVARAAANNVHVVMLDPEFQNQSYENAVAIGLGAFGAMQRRILETDMRSAFFETFGKRMLEKFPASALGAASAGTGFDAAALERFSKLLYASDFAVIRPQSELPVSVGGFDETEHLMQTYQRGYADASRGFAKYTFDFQI